jgi:hypothetical protein
MATNKDNKEKETTNKTKAKAPAKRRKPGPPKGVSNNPAGRPKGSKNKISYDIRKAIFEKVGNGHFIKGLFSDIKKIDDFEKRAKLKLELIKLFVPRPLNEDEEKDRDIRSAIFDKLAGNEKDENNND